ncbi:MAG TPA: o-succinylbenzoate synthase, partial [Acidobacteriota bacterium]|nr:o-succinylbenzoate synthase [Acidobacteriota bacterium]
TTSTNWEMLEHYLLPQLRHFRTIGQYLKLSAQYRGHPMAKATLEAALWDLLAQSQSRPLFRLWGGTKNKIGCGVSVGLQKDRNALIQKIADHLKEGYQRIKIKIKPGKDRDLLETIRGEFPDIPLMADANAAYNLTDVELLKSLDPYHLMMIEQPLYYEDIFEHSKLAPQLSTPICLDESIVSLRAAEAALALKSCRIINIKTGRVGGHTESIRIHDLAAKNNIPVWCGGMLESGIGRAHNLALASLPNFTLPGDTSASSRYWHRDVIVPPVTIDAQGFAVLPEKPGMGFEIDIPYLDSLTSKRANIAF